jgi:hypothetical protein
MDRQMFPYDPELLAAVRTPPKDIPNAIRIMVDIDATCSDVDGFRWFRSLYLEVTQAVEARVSFGGFNAHTNHARPPPRHLNPAGPIMPTTPA